MKTDFLQCFGFSDFSETSSPISSPSPDLRFEFDSELSSETLTSVLEVCKRPLMKRCQKSLLCCPMPFILENVSVFGLVIGVSIHAVAVKRMSLEPCEFFIKTKTKAPTQRVFWKTYFAWGEIKREFNSKLYVKFTLNSETL